MIVVVTRLYPSARNPQAGRFVQNFVEALRREANSEVVVLRLTTGRGLFRLKKVDGTYQLGLLPNPKLGRVVNRLIRFLNVFGVRFFVDWSELREVTMVYSHFFASAQVGSPIADKIGVPHCLGVGENYNYLTSLSLKYDYQYVRGLLQSSKWVVSVSELNMSFLQDEFASSAEYCYLPNGVNPEVFNTLVTARQWALNPKDTVIAYTGHFNERKGVRRLLEATVGMNSLKFILMGNGERLDDSRILFQGTLDPSQVAGCLASADVFVLPTLAEGWCNALNEAMAVGLPIISSNIDSVKEQMDGVDYIPVDPGDVESIRRGIQIFLGLTREEIDGMKRSSLKRSEQLDIRQRAHRFLNFTNHE